LTDKIELKNMLSARFDRLKDGEDGWKMLVDAGVLAIPFDENYGGMGLGPQDAFPVLEALGERAIALPYLETVLLSGLLLQKAGGEHAGHWLPLIGSGNARLAAAWIDDEASPVTAIRTGDGWRLTGRKLLSVGAAEADAIIVMARYNDEIVTFIVPPAQIEMQSYPTIDGRTAADLQFDDLNASDSHRLEVDRLMWDEIVDIGTAAVISEAAAIMARLVNDTRDYCQQRKQFEAPIASFQAVQHRLVDMHIAARQAAAAANLAAGALSHDNDARIKAISAAKVATADAARFVGQNAVQLHGGMGMTEELAISALFKRLTIIENEFGSREDHLVHYMT